MDAAAATTVAGAMLAISSPVALLIKYFLRFKI
jgi:hypothetical protein